MQTFEAVVLLPGHHCPPWGPQGGHWSPPWRSILIQQSLDALPPAYDDVIWQGKVTQTYEWIFDHFGGDASAN
jgi:hypothetical protein